MLIIFTAHTKMEILNSNLLRAYKFDTLVPDSNTYVAVGGTDFHNGTIELDVCGKLLPDAPDYSRGFIGIVFRGKEDSSEFESFYIRPTNGKNCDDPVRKSHGCQYFSFPGYTFAYYREFGILGYEGQVDTIDLGEWSHIKAVIHDNHAEFFVDGVSVLTVDGLKHGSDARGNVGLYIDNGTDGYFKNLNIEYED